MAKNYEENENITVEDYEESRRTLTTPVHQMIDSTSYSNININFDDFLNYSEPLPAMPSVSPVVNFVPSVEESNDIPFDRNEWQTTDPCTGRRRPPYQNEYLQLLLENPRYSSYICWLDKNQGLLQILLPNEVVALWEKVKNRQTIGAMSYPTFSRGLRYYYKKGLMIKTNKKYTFCFNLSKYNISS